MGPSSLLSVCGMALKDRREVSAQIWTNRSERGCNEKRVLRRNEVSLVSPKSVLLRGGKRARGGGCSFGASQITASLKGKLDCALAAGLQWGETWRGGQQGTRVCSSSSSSSSSSSGSRTAPPPFFSGTGKPYKCS